MPLFEKIIIEPPFWRFVLSTSKGRHFAFVQKIDNLPFDWQFQLSELHFPMLAIVHDRDSGVSPHVHVFFSFGSPVRPSVALSLIPESFSIVHVELVRHSQAYQRYMLHLDETDPSKFLYDIEDFICFCGFDPDIKRITPPHYSQVLDLIDEYQCFNAVSLISVLRSLHPDWIEWVVPRLGSFRDYMLSLSRSF